MTLETKYQLREINSMVTTEPETSTQDECQESIFPQIEHHGYCYFPLQENLEIAAQSSGTFWAPVIPVDYVYSVNREAQSATAFFTPNISQRAVRLLPDELICKQIMLLADRFYSTRFRTQIHSLHEFLDAVSTYATQVSPSDLEIEQSAINIFDAYQHEEFDADIADEFTNTLDRLIRPNGKPAIFVIGNLIIKHVLDDDIISEILKALGRIEDENTKHERYELLMGSIRNESATIRDGAVSGLSFLDDKRALPQLRMLFETENAPILKNNIMVAIRGLEY